MPGTAATTSRTSLHFATAKVGSSPIDVHRSPLLLDDRQGLPIAPVGQPISSLAPRNILWRRHARTGRISILQSFVARACAIREFPRLGGGTPSCPNRTRRLR